MRFDDIDFIGGDDIIEGGSGNDILHGQRGDDFLDGGKDDDELFGELGHDELLGGKGHDILIGDVGHIVRAFESDGSVRLDENGAWHKDVFLEEVGFVIGSINLGSTDFENLDPELAAKLLLADMLVLAGAFESDGTKHLDPVDGAWDTKVLLIDLVEAYDDIIDGGDGDDLIFGQRGNDTLLGGGDDDAIFGDRVSSGLPFGTNLPQVFNGLRLLGTPGDGESGLDLAVGGTLIITPVTLYPEEGDLNAPFVMPSTFGSVLPEAMARVPRRVADRHARPGRRRSASDLRGARAGCRPPPGHVAGQRHHRRRPWR